MTPPNDGSAFIVLVEDDPDDQLIAEAAIKRTDWNAHLVVLSNGEDLMELLHKYGRSADGALVRPSLVLLDLNMPRKNGFEVMREIRGDDDLRDLPVVVLSTSSRQEDVEKAFKLGCNSFHSKPSSLAGMTSLMQDMMNYWFKTSRIPKSGLT